MSAIKYRPDIDGLRAVAVVPVVLFHAGVNSISGGFVGVDIFFVISGYLITGIILGNVESGNFSISEFYRRRIQRIIPALITVISASTVAAWFIFPPDALSSFGLSLASVAIFSSNFWFWKSIDYFANAAHVEPLLHTWSLAVEEQFYIFYPMLILAISRTKINPRLCLSIIGLFSFLLAIALLPRTPSAVFYLLPTRAWELIIGGLLACNLFQPPRSDRVAVVSGFLGLSLIAASVVIYDSEVPFPGLAAVPPCLGAAMIIWSGSRSTGFTYKFLASSPFVQIGRASYSFYLWHFPLFAFSSYLIGKPLEADLGLVLSIVSLCLALVSLVVIETPIRRSKALGAWLAPLMGLALCGLIGLLLHQNAGYPWRLSGPIASVVAVADDEKRHPSRCMTNQVVVPPTKACELGNSAAKPNVLLWGDSHAMVVATAMDAEARRVGESFLFAASADCPPGLGFRISPSTQPGLTRTTAYRYCGQYNSDMARLALSDNAIETVVIAARWTNWRIGQPGNPVEEPVDIRLEDANGIASSPSDNTAIWKAGFEKLILAIKAAGKTVYVVGPIPEPAFNVPQRYYVANFGFAEYPQTLSEKDFERRHQIILAYLRAMEKDGVIRVIWPHTSLCENGLCRLRDLGGLLYFDHNHLSVHGALRTSNLYAPVFMGLADREGKSPS